MASITRNELHHIQTTLQESRKDRNKVMFNKDNLGDNVLLKKAIKQDNSRFPETLSDSYLLSVTYDGSKRTACLKMYEPKTRKIFLWYDNTRHLPYCFSDLPIKELEKINKLKNHPGFDHMELSKKYDPLMDKEVIMTKIVAKDPLAIGGRFSNHIRDIIPKAWEANIRYHNCYIYDRQLFLGMPYRVVNGNLLLVESPLPQNIYSNMKKPFESEDETFRNYIDSWITLFQYPIPSIHRVALDIEVSQSAENRIPDSREAKEKIIAVSFIDSDETKRILLLKRPGVKTGKSDLFTVNVEFYDDEKEIILEIFKILNQYPIVLTFNGDDFDLRYIHNRALNLGFQRNKIPIELRFRSASLKYGIHIDLYKFFFNKAIQIYAFGKKYSKLTLDSVAKSILGIGKIEIETSPSRLTYFELAKYCLKDSELTVQLTTFDDELVMKLIIVLMRISKMPINDLIRYGVSAWIRNLMCFEHRRLNFLIPRPKDILHLKGQTVTKSIIKGKKFKGAIVVDPKPGIHFNIAVLDFASLYPSIIKIYNLSYETILCSHSECKLNTIPDLPHWVCTRRKGLFSTIIGSLRDVRVKWYKKKVKDDSLPRSLRNLYNIVQLTLKVLLNASYGVMGAENFNLYCPPLAEAVTAIGRYSITSTIEKANSLGIEVVYGDTDSIFLKSPTQRQIRELLSWSEKELGMELEIEKHYRYSVFSTLKKNYLGVCDDGSVDIKGLTGKKKHIPEFLKIAFMEMTNILGEIKSPSDFERAKKKIKEIIRTCYDKLKKRQYNLSELALNITISKSPDKYVKTTPQHVKAASLLVNAGYEIKPGDIISFIKTTNDLGVKPIQLASIREVDTNKYKDYLESTFEQVLDALGVGFNEIMGIQKLESFF